MIEATLDDLLERYRRAVERYNVAEDHLSTVKLELTQWIKRLEKSSDRDIKAIAAEYSGSIANLR